MTDVRGPGVPITACRAEYERPAGLRTLVCQLDAGHTGNHIERDTGTAWASTTPRMALAQPRTVGICGQSPTTLLVAPPRSTSRPCELAHGHTGWHEADDGMRWSAEPDTNLLTVDGLTAAQDIRARALHEAAAVVAEVGNDGDLDADCDLILEVAERFAAYITTGARPPVGEDSPVDTDIGTCTGICCYPGEAAPTTSTVEAR